MGPTFFSSTPNQYRAKNLAIISSDYFNALVMCHALDVH